MILDIRAFIITHNVHLEWVLLGLFIIWNVMGFIVYAVDKHRAVHNRWRVSERTLLMYMLFGAGVGCYLAMRFLRHKTQKRSFKTAALLGVSIGLVFLVHIVESVVLGSHVGFREHVFSASNWPAALDGYRIGFVTDFHAIQDHRVAQLVVELNQRNLDLLLLGGDFEMFNNHYQGTLRELARTQTKDGIWGVDGNHDIYHQVFTAMRNHGIQVLDNTGVSLHPGFFLAGVQDDWRRHPDVRQAVASAQPDDFLLVLSHNPDVSMNPDNPWFDLMLAGHTHGGQVNPFGFPLYLLRHHISRYGLRFASGFAYGYHGQPVFTSVGVGDYYVPRVFAQPEVVIFTMKS